MIDLKKINIRSKRFRIIILLGLIVPPLFKWAIWHYRRI